MADVEVGQARLVGVLVAGIVWAVTGTDAMKTYYLTDYCGDSFSLRRHNVTAFTLLLTRNVTYSPNMRCDMKIFAPRDYGLMFLFTDVDVHNCRDFADVYERESDIYNGLDPEICDTLPAPLVTRRYHAMIGFNSDEEGEGRGFKVIITAFHTEQCNKSEEFRCTNQRCIDSSLKCSRYDNCGDNSNNDDCHDVNSTLIILVTCGLVSVILIIGVIAVYCKRKYGTGRSPSLNCPSHQACPDFPSPPISRWFCRRTQSQTTCTSTEDTSLSRMESSRNSAPSSTNYRTPAPSESFLPSPPPYTEGAKPWSRHIPGLYPDPPPSYDEVHPPSYEDAVRNV